MSPFGLYTMFLGAMLWSLSVRASREIDIPTMCVEDTITVCFDLSCVARLKALGSKYEAPRNMDVLMDDFNATCKGVWGPKIEDMSGTLDAFIEGSVGLDVNVHGTRVWPTDFIVDKCQVSDLDIDVHIRTGHLSSHDRWLVDSIVESALRNGLEAELCPGIENVIEVNGTDWLVNDLTPALMKVISSSADITPVVTCPDCIDWSMSHVLDVANTGLEAILRSAPNPLTVALSSSPMLNVTTSFSTNVELQPKTVMIYGLDSAMGKNWLHSSANSNESIEFELGFRDLTIIFECDLHVEGHAITEGNVTASMHRTWANGTLFAPLNMSNIANLYLDELCGECVLNAFKNLTITSLLVDTHLTQLEIDTTNVGGMAFDVIELADNFFDLILHGYQSLVHDVIRGIAQGPFRARLNEGLWRALAQAPHLCPAHSESSTISPDFIVWGNTTLISFINALDLGASGMNTIVNVATEGTGTIESGGVTVSGLNTWTEVSLFATNSENPYNMNFSLAMEYLEVDWGSLTVDSYKDVSSIKINNTAAALDLLLKVDKNRLGDLQVFQLRSPICLVSTAEKISIDEIAFSASEVAVETARGGRVIHDADVDDVDVQYLNRLLNVLTQKAPNLCANGYEPAEANDDDDVADIDVATSILIGTVAIMFVLSVVMNWRQILGASEWCMSGRLCRMKYSWDTSMFNSHSLPKWARYGIPFLIVANICLFVSSNNTWGALVLLEIDVGDNVIEPDPVFKFGLANSVQDMWDAQVYALAVLVALFSGGWPYVKLVAMLVCWFAPVEMLSAETNYWLLLWLDALGKWSLMDTFVMVLFMVSFAFDLYLADNLTVYVTVQPDIGFYTFLYGTMLSLFLGHGVLYFWKLIQHPASKEIDTKGEEEGVMKENCSFELKKPMMVQEFSTMLGKFRFTVLGNALVIATMLVSIVSVGVACYEKVMEFRFKGLLGAMLAITNPGSEKAAYSVLDIFSDLPSKSGMGSSAGLASIQYSVLFFALAVPVIYTVMLLAMWCLPLPSRHLDACNTLLEIAQAWSALEVFAVAIAAALLEIQQFATFIIGSNCDAINDFLKANAGDKLGGDDVCFDVVATLRPPCWTLFLAVFLLLFFCLPLTRLIGSKIEEISTSNTDISISNQVKFALDGDLSTLDEPLLTGYGIKRKRSLTLGARIVKYTSLLWIVECIEDEFDEEHY